MIKPFAKPAFYLFVRPMLYPQRGAGQATGPSALGHQCVIAYTMNQIRKNSPTSIAPAQPNR